MEGGVGSYIYIIYIVEFEWLTGVTGKFAIFCLLLLYGKI